MHIAKDTVVSFHYTLTDSEGVLLEDSRKAQEVLYMHGHPGMLPGLESALEGKAPGDTVVVELPPEKAYGRRVGGKVGRVPLKQVRLPGNKPVKGKLTSGAIVEIRNAEGSYEATVIKQGLKAVDVDTNHPYADKTLSFDIEVLSVREATATELAHGHAHGAGGCGH